MCICLIYAPNAVYGKKRFERQVMAGDLEVRKLATHDCDTNAT